METEFQRVWNRIKAAGTFDEVTVLNNLICNELQDAVAYSRLSQRTGTTRTRKRLSDLAADVTFFLSSRCVSRPEDTAMRKRLERLSRVSEEAAMQSGRGRIPEVRWIPRFMDMVTQAAAYDLALFLWEEAAENSLRSALRAFPGTPADLALVSGPEGGFSREEAAAAESGGLIPVTLGKRILRCETAPLCALSAVMYETENLE